ncbi:MAG TPA: hypothetical protein VHS07_04155 [Candidatus Binataceae bacterium]|nr:hypothetical protein [Candidatus Binataceae bacterium]
MNRGGSVNRWVCLSFTVLLLGLGQGAAHAQTKLSKPLNGSTLRITKSGSYFLGANYVTALGALPAITVAVNNVTINLNGFSLIGPGGTATSSAIGINVAAGVSGLTVVNGTIAKIRGTALVLGSNGIASGLQLIGNNGDGVQCTTACLVTNNVISGNTGTGLNFSDGTSGYQNNVISANGGTVTGGTSLGHNVCNGSLC